MKLDKELKGLTKSFTFALRGLKHAIFSERNLRIHIVATIFILIFAKFYNFSRMEYALLLITIAVVVSCELLNTSIEAVVDMVSPSYSKGAQVAKDIAAGAVFISALFAVIIGIVLFWDINVFKYIFNYFISKPLLLLALICVILIGGIFIFNGFISAKKISNSIRKD